MYELLYGEKSQHREKLYQNHGKKTEEIEFEKQKEVCTFKPNLNKSSHSYLLAGKATSNITPRVRPVKTSGAGSYSIKFQNQKKSINEQI